MKCIRLNTIIRSSIIMILLLSYLNNYSQTVTFSKIISTPLDESIKDVVEDSLGNFYFV